MKTCLILNPTAGGVSEVREALDRALDGYETVVVRETETTSDTRRFAAQAAGDGFERVIAGGGDGTLNEVLNGLAPDLDRIELGLIPLGTGNDLARTLDIPREMPEGLCDAIELAFEGEAQPLDAARVRSGSGPTRYFLNVSVGGFSGEVDGKTETEVKAAWGPLSYVRGALGALSELEPYRTRVVLEPGTDDEEEVRLATFTVVIANGRFVGGGLQVAPTAAPDDGRLDLVAIQAAPVARLSLLAPRMLVGQHLDDELILHRQAERFTIRSEPPMPFNADGEAIGETPVEYEVLPAAVRFVRPERPRPTA